MLLAAYVSSCTAWRESKINVLHSRCRPVALRRLILVAISSWTRPGSLEPGSSGIAGHISVRLPVWQAQVRWEKLAGTLEPGRFCILLKPLGGLNVAADSVFTWI
jgi:hypothetical protein